MRLRTGVIGTGVIGQVMHLHFLRELADRYEIAAADRSKIVPGTVAAHDTRRFPESFSR